ncbi:MAG: hypothetical protein J2P31_14975 [Blastocatellia bacterium]|nr:hypothetical protein [Blastocatellia bacterium]
MKLTIVLVALLAPISLSFSAVKQNFSGKWVLDKERSFGIPAGLEQTLTIRQTGDQIKMVARSKTDKEGEQVVAELYLINGQEMEFTPQSPPNAQGKRKTSLLPNGLGIQIEDQIIADGKTVNRISRRWSLSLDGKTLTIDYFIDDQKTSHESRRVSIKK